MKVYQLRLLDFNLLLEPVFKTEAGAKLLKNKYQGRKIKIEERVIEDTIIEDDIYRILVHDEEGSYLDEELFTNIDTAYEHLNNIKESNARIVKYPFSSEKSIRYDWVSV